MKLQRVEIKKLFGVFNHTISVNNTSGITIIIGENGLGKTILLEIIEAFFNTKFYYFNSVVFDEIIFEFNDKIKWQLTKSFTKEQGNTLSLTQINKNRTKYKPFTINSFQLSNNQRNDQYIAAVRIARNYPFLRRISHRIWEDRMTGEILKSEDIISKYSRHMPSNNIFTNEEIPKWFKKRIEEIKISLIETQRLINDLDREDKSHRRTVEKYSQELSSEIKSHLTESAELSSKLDRTYPTRLINRLKKSANVTDDDLNSELVRLEEKRELLNNVGLIEIDKHSSFLKIEKSQEVVREVLMLYVEDSFKKFGIFDDLSKKIEIFLEIINKRFKHKKLYIDKDQGFLLKSTIKNDKSDNQNIPVSKLSSGEQNELVLFYFLLFKVSPNSLILIDEPEVSLHISWQNCFIEDLKQITKLNNLDVVIATHSPDIIANNWDLRVELTGLE